MADLTHKQRILELLSDGEPHSHVEGYALGVMLHSRVSDLRRDGHTIECWRDGDLSMYRLAALAEPEPSPSSTIGAGDETLSSGSASDGELTLFVDAPPRSRERWAA